MTEYKKPVLVEGKKVESNGIRKKCTCSGCTTHEPSKTN